MQTINVVFVHGWSVSSLETYGQLPERLLEEGPKNGFTLQIENIYLGRYISFHDEVRLQDISRAFNMAVKDQLKGISNFICITHSTGGPVIRDWLDRYCNKGKNVDCSLSHLIMLAPANFGSALAQLGKSTIGRLKAWFGGVEPGQGVLDWLSLGSAEAWSLNESWILRGANEINPSGFFPFVLTGQSIDRNLYDNLNSYTGETGSDGVVRTASADLNATYIRLEQPFPEKGLDGTIVSADLILAKVVKAPLVPLRVIRKKSHSGAEMGIMNSVRTGDDKSKETVDAIFSCVKVETSSEYEELFAKFQEETAQVQKDEKVERENRTFLSDRLFIHDRYTMVIFRVRDSEGYPINDFDLLLTAGPDNNPNHLPDGFFVDRQQNKINRNIITYYLNYDIMNGTDSVFVPGETKKIREASVGIDTLGIIIQPRPKDGFVRYLDCRYIAAKELFSQALNPNSTTLIDIVLQRVVDKEVFRLEGLNSTKSFKGTKPTDEIAN